MLTFTACEDGASKAKEEVPAEVSQAEGGTSQYVCPMYCEGSGSNEPGACPVCGMDIVLRADLEKGDGGHEGHNH